MNRSTTEIPKDMFKSLKTISLSLAALLLGAGSACGQQSDSYAHKVNTLIGTRGVGLTSGYLYPGATYPFGMVQFTPTYFAKRGGFVINQLSGGGCSHMGNFPTFPVTGKLDSSPENILDYRVGICGEQGHARLLRSHRAGGGQGAAHRHRAHGHGPAMNTPRERRSAP